MVRVGGPVWQSYDDPESWVAAVKDFKYTAAYCPVSPEADVKTIRAYEAAAKKADIIIAEVGAWSNPLSPTDMIREEALEVCKRNLALADEIGARCCVNISGSRGTKWDGPYAGDLTEDTFEMVVDTVRDIVDSVKPERSFYALETMPWMYPDSPDSYLKLIEAVDRKAFAVHLDPVNLVNSPSKYFKNAELIQECVSKLGPYIRSCHAKDVVMRDQLPVQLEEVRPGLGELNYQELLQQLETLNSDVPLMLEHLPSDEDYWLAAEHIRTVASQKGLKV